MFARLKAEQAKAEDANTGKLGELLLAINNHLKRIYTIQSLSHRPADLWPLPAQQLHVDCWQAPYRAAEGNRRRNRREGRVQIPLRQALRRQKARTRG
jgi:hypothetical protein